MIKVKKLIKLIRKNDNDGLNEFAINPATNGVINQPNPKDVSNIPTVLPTFPLGAFLEVNEIVSGNTTPKPNPIIIIDKINAKYKFIKWAINNKEIAWANVPINKRFFSPIFIKILNCNEVIILVISKIENDNPM